MSVLFRVEGQRFWRRAEVTRTEGEWLTLHYEVAGRAASARVHVEQTLVDAPGDVRSGDEVLVESPSELGVFWPGTIRTQRGDTVEVRVAGMGRGGRDAVWPASPSAVRRVPLVIKPSSEL